MFRKKSGEIEWLEFELFAQDPRIVHAIFLRHGGVSSDSFASLNLIKGKGDDIRNVYENQQRIVDVLKIDNIVSSMQVHGIKIEHVDGGATFDLECDGLMTNRRGIGLMAGHADCQAAIFYDPINQAIATAHAGWRGQVQNIYREAILSMLRDFNTDPKNLLVGISPSLGPQNSEFKNYRLELPEAFWKFQIKPTYFDLWAIAEAQLIECGVLADHIEIAKIDTFAHPHDFFHIADKGLKESKKISRVAMVLSLL